MNDILSTLYPLCFAIVASLFPVRCCLSRLGGTGPRSVGAFRFGAFLSKYLGRLGKIVGTAPGASVFLLRGSTISVPSGSVNFSKSCIMKCVAKWREHTASTSLKGLPALGITRCQVSNIACNIRWISYMWFMIVCILKAAFVKCDNPITFSSEIEGFFQKPLAES